MDARQLTRLVILILTLGVSLSLAQSRPDAGFDAFKEDSETFTESNTEFESYRSRLEAGFAAYKQAADAAIRDVQREASRYFRDADVGSATRWVEYRDDYRTRRTIDFGRNTLKVEMNLPPGGQGQTRKLAGELIDLLTEDTRQAFGRDRVAGRIEAALARQGSIVVTDTVESSPILAPALTGTANPDPETVKDTVLGLMKRGQITSSRGAGGMQLVTFSVALPESTTHKRAEQYRPTVTKHGKHRSIDTALVYAVIHTESAFNPMARSSVPAFGLMQIVPKSGGFDATRLIYGKSRILSPSFLYDGDNNIMVGTAYLHLLYYEYMKGIKNPESRLYCAMAAYNTGPGNVARAFTGNRNMNEAAKVVNGMGSRAVYDRLIAKLPYAETRNYLKTVSRRMNAYRGF